MSLPATQPSTTDQNAPATDAPPTAASPEALNPHFARVEEEDFRPIDHQADTALRPSSEGELQPRPRDHPAVSSPSSGMDFTMQMDKSRFEETDALDESRDVMPSVDVLRLTAAGRHKSRRTCLKLGILLLGEIYQRLIATITTDSINRERSMPRLNVLSFCSSYSLGL